MRIRSISLSVALLLSVAVWAADAESSFQTYRNARFGYSVEVPSEFRKGAAPTNNDGRVFYDRKSRGILTVFGMYNALETSPESYAAEREADWKDLKGAITYRAMRKGWFVLSGTIDAEIFYERVLFSDDRETIATLLVRYPESEKERFGAFVTRASRSLRFAD